MNLNYNAWSGGPSTARIIAIPVGTDRQRFKYIPLAEERFRSVKMLYFSAVRRELDRHIRLEVQDECRSTVVLESRIVRTKIMPQAPRPLDSLVRCKYMKLFQFNSPQNGFSACNIALVRFAFFYHSPIDDQCIDSDAIRHRTQARSFRLR